jgi:hypothetical protein
VCLKILNKQTVYRMFISNEDLRKQKYSIDELEKNISNFRLKTLLLTQTLTAPFCVKYILSEEYASCNEDTYIDSEDILCYQPHIASAELQKLYGEYLSQLL